MLGLCLVRLYWGFVSYFYVFPPEFTPRNHPGSLLAIKVIEMVLYAPWLELRSEAVGTKRLLERASPD